MENLHSLVKKIFYPLIACLGLAVSGFAYSETVLLYQNNFESTNVAPIRNCGYALDIRSINDLHGQPGAQFSQIFTVETVLINATGGSPNYSDPSGTGGNYSIGMLSSAQDDKLSLTFDSQNLGFINIGMDISSIDVQGCGGPFGIAAPKYMISLFDSPGGIFDITNPVLPALDQQEITGVMGPDQWTFDWTSHVVALDASESSDGNVSIVWDLIQSGYAAFDNLIITASTDPGDLGDGDGVCVYQEATPGQEDFELLGEADIFDLSGITAAQAYTYAGASYTGTVPESIPDVSQLVPWQTSEGLVLGIIHDQRGDGTGGNLSFSFDLTGDIAEALVRDDGAEMAATGGTWRWVGCCTDGGVLGTLDGSWSLVIDPAFSSGIETWQVTGSGGAIALDMTKRVKLELCEPAEPALPLAKEVINGPDRDLDEQVDSVIEVKQGATTEYTWKINYKGPEDVAVLIEDTAPAESVVEMVNGELIGLPCGGSKLFSDDSGDISVWRGGKLGKSCRSSTNFAWYPDSNEEMLTVDIRMRESPGKGHKSPAFAPTSCGALYLNNGAVAWELDPATSEPVLNSETGDPEPPLFESNQLCVAAVSSDLLPGDGFGPEDDHDGDGIASYAEACTNEVRTDPCQTDTDGDGVDDGVDECPLEGLPGVGEILVNGCIIPLPL